MAWQNFHQHGSVSVPNVNLRILAPAGDECFILPTEGRSDNETTLLLPSVPVNHHLTFEIPRVDLFRGDIHKKIARVSREAQRSDRCGLSDEIVT
eukprot:CAMPEP_0184380240 /NCGR_PEP_ID=MMETSP0007-20130409/4578_1 /TAXON_ID=97485 /ORGANISM="Prymnesium parvum, Strain Texoma1" /LENGTH=94 /DNA_ID=CAMNT_0026725379 /DNA_START=315 /DNA_END=596 /DNA_ORIENTATION=+